MEDKKIKTRLEKQRIIEAATKKLGVLKEKVYINIQNTGNISSACILSVLTELKREGKLKKNALVGYGVLEQG